MLDNYRRIPHSMPLFEEDPAPRPQEPSGPIVFWIIWLLLGIPLIFLRSEMFFAFHYMAQHILTTTWLGFSTRFSARFIVPAAICYTPIFLMIGFRAPLAALITISICLAMFGLPWVILRAFRLITLDFLQPSPAGGLVAPKLAERAQFSLRTIGAVCLISALCCALWVGADHWREFRELRYLVAIFVPCELLFLLGMLSRLAKPWRFVLLILSMLLMVGSLWLLRRGNTDELWLCLLIPADQFVVLAMLRRAGYRVGMPRTAVIEQVLQPTKQPASPWDE